MPEDLPHVTDCVVGGRDAGTLYKKAQIILSIPAGWDIDFTHVTIGRGVPDIQRVGHNLILNMRKPLTTDEIQKRKRKKMVVENKPYIRSGRVILPRRTRERVARKEDSRNPPPHNR
jgi:hypothetical protein